MVDLDTLIPRIRSEFREMPGLRLTQTQACRMWQLDATTCRAVLAYLVDQEFLTVSERGLFALRSAESGSE